MVPMPRIMSLASTTLHGRIPTKPANAVRMERKLELSGEGHRFFDLGHWGVAEQEISKYLLYESTILYWTIGSARFTPGKNEYYPIPQSKLTFLGRMC